MLTNKVNVTIPRVKGERAIIPRLLGRPTTSSKAVSIKVKETPPVISAGVHLAFFLMNNVPNSSDRPIGIRVKSQLKLGCSCSIVGSIVHLAL